MKYFTEKILRICNPAASVAGMAGPRAGTVKLPDAGLFAVACRGEACQKLVHSQQKRMTNKVDFSADAESDSFPAFLRTNQL